MAMRVVVLGYGEAIEIAPLDADVLVNDKWLRVSLGSHGGPLADATVCYPHKKLLGAMMENATEAQWKQALARIRRLCTTAKSITLP